MDWNARPTHRNRIVVLTAVATVLLLPASARPTQAEILGKGVFEHHIHVHNPLVAGYPNPTDPEAQAKLEALLSNPYISGAPPRSSQAPIRSGRGYLWAWQSEVTATPTGKSPTGTLAIRAAATGE